MCHASLLRQVEHLRRRADEASTTLACAAQQRFDRRREWQNHQSCRTPREVARSLGIKHTSSASCVFVLCALELLFAASHRGLTWAAALEKVHIAVRVIVKSPIGSDRDPVSPFSLPPTGALPGLGGKCGHRSMSKSKEPNRFRQGCPNPLVAAPMEVMVALEATLED